MPLTIYLVHLKSMGSPRNGVPGRDASMPVRMAEAKAIRKIIEDRFGKDHARDKRWMICGDFNDYRERVIIGGDVFSGYTFAPVREEESCLDVLLGDGFCENLVERRPELDRWTLYHTRGPQERHLCQLDYILVSPLWQNETAMRCPTSFAAGSHIERRFRPARRSSDIHASAGTGRRRRIIARSP